MRKTLIGLSTALLLGMAGNAMADTIDYHITYDPTDILMDASATNTALVDIDYNGSGVVTGTFTHLIKTLNLNFDITDDPKYSSDQIFSNGTITLTVTDNENGSLEKATFTFETGTDLTSLTTATNIHSDLWTQLFTVDAGAFDDGEVWATLTATTGDFYFDQAELNVTSTTPVPEPATMLLLGTGLAGLGGVMRKRRSGRRAS